METQPVIVVPVSDAYLRNWLAFQASVWEQGSCGQWAEWVRSRGF